MIFGAIFRPRREIHSDFDVSPYYPKAIHFESEIEPTFETHFYKPLWAAILALAARMRKKFPERQHPRLLAYTSSR